MQYIADILGIEIAAEPWSGAAKLPYYLNDRYSFAKVSLGGVFCLFVKPAGGLDTLTAVKKHIAKIQEAEPLPVVLELDVIAAPRRKSLIGARIPFAAPGCQLYLPFMGVALTERYASEKQPGETLMPSAQLLLFYYLYSKTPELHTHGADEKLKLSAMQISRAIRQLKALGLVDARKDGVRLVLTGDEAPAVLFERAKPYLLDPIRKRIYAERETIPSGLPLSGISALSEMTMLGAPATKTVAFYGKADEITGMDTLIDSDTQTEVEIWKYDPALLSERPGIADPISVAASLLTAGNERVEQAVDEMLNDLWG
jgi:DNA-binding transcriptional ArsR family regulator